MEVRVHNALTRSIVHGPSNRRVIVRGNQIPVVISGSCCELLPAHLSIRRDDHLVGAREKPICPMTAAVEGEHGGPESRVAQHPEETEAMSGSATHVQRVKYHESPWALRALHLTRAGIPNRLGRAPSAHRSRAMRTARKAVLPHIGMQPARQVSLVGARKRARVFFAGKIAATDSILDDGCDDGHSGVVSQTVLGPAVFANPRAFTTVQ